MYTLYNLYYSHCLRVLITYRLLLTARRKPNSTSLTAQHPCRSPFRVLYHCLAVSRKYEHPCPDQSMGTCIYPFPGWTLAQGRSDRHDRAGRTTEHATLTLLSHAAVMPTKRHILCRCFKDCGVNRATVNP